MFKTYQKYIIANFLSKFITISFIFLSLVFILGILEEISFFKNLEVNFFFPYFLTFLNAPITLFEIFPFIFLISTQFVFYDLFKNEELNLLKSNGLSNLKIVKILFLSSILIGVCMIFIYYNLASKLKFFYTDIKNSYSKDNKYLAAVTESGLWLKDEINETILIIKANHIEEKFLVNVVVNEFTDNFDLIRTIQSDRVFIETKIWNLNNPTVTLNNISTNNLGSLKLQTNFDKEKINNLFSNISTLNILELFNLKKDFENLGYSSDEILIHLLKLFSMPLLYGLLTVLSSIVMFNFKRDKSLFFHIIIGILMSVIIYYMNFMFGSLGKSGKISIIASIFFPILFISIITTIGLIRVNEK